MGIRKERGFPQQLEKSLAKDARLFHSSHRPNSKDLFTNTFEKEKHKTACVPIPNCLNRGVHPNTLCPNLCLPSSSQG
jgi:hypothetical protein